VLNLHWKVHSIFEPTSDDGAESAGIPRTPGRYRVQPAHPGYRQVLERGATARLSESRARIPASRILSASRPKAELSFRTPGRFAISVARPCLRQAFGVRRIPAPLGAAVRIVRELFPEKRR